MKPLAQAHCWANNTCAELQFQDWCERVRPVSKARPCGVAVSSVQPEEAKCPQPFRTASPRPVEFRTGLLWSVEKQDHGLRLLEFSDGSLVGCMGGCGCGLARAGLATLDWWSDDSVFLERQNRRSHPHLSSLRTRSLERGVAGKHKAAPCLLRSFRYHQSFFRKLYKTSNTSLLSAATAGAERAGDGAVFISPPGPS